MEAELRRKVARFRTAVTVFAEMEKEGIFTPEEMRVLTTDLAKKTGISSFSIFGDIDLISTGNDGNM